MPTNPAFNNIILRDIILTSTLMFVYITPGNVVIHAFNATQSWINGCANNNQYEIHISYPTYTIIRFTFLIKKS